MKNFAKYIACAVVAIASTGCIASNFEDNTFCRDAELSLTFTDGSTRAVGTNDDTYNEDKLVSIQVFLYPTGGTGDNAVFTYRMANLGNSKVQSTSISTSISAGQLANLFPNGATTCDAYVIANYADDLTSADDTSVAKLKETALSTDFTKVVDVAGDVRLATQIAAQSSFVMDSEGATVSKTGNQVTGEIFLTRAAAKIRLFVELGTVSNADDTWVPNSNYMTVSFRNCSTEGKIDDNSDNQTVEATTLRTSDFVYFNMTDSGGGTTTPGTSATTRATTSKFTTFTPFYSYASAWNEDLKEDDAAYLTLKIPWGKSSNDAITTYSYEVPINIDGKKLERNKYYIINLKVGVLGDLETIDQATFEYNVIDWKSEPIEVSMENPRYLVVNEHNYEMFNEEYLLIPYSSSDECIITGLTITQDDLYSGGTKSDHGDACTATLVEVDGKTYIKVYNDLDNNIFSNGAYNANFDFTKYNISLTISHKNADGTASSVYTENITIKQYPALSGISQINSDATSGGDNDNNGYVWVNSYRGSSTSGVTNFDDCDGTSSSTNGAQYMYVFTVSSVQGTKYLVGDPRTPYIDNLDEYGFTFGTGFSTYTQASRKGLLYYYPTDGNYDDTEATSHTYNMVAPKFRISSGYGAIDAYSAKNRDEYKYVKGRCASYQEDGYPAGRWRLPTAAEFELVNTLVNNDQLPPLYVKNMRYWCAHGYGVYENGKVELSNDASYSDVGHISVRCVYDDWYWGSEPVNDNKTNPDGDKFTWGDEPRE